MAYAATDARLWTEDRLERRLKRFSRLLPGIAVVKLMEQEPRLLGVDPDAAFAVLVSLAACFHNPLSVVVACPSLLLCDASELSQRVADALSTLTAVLGNVGGQASASCCASRERELSASRSFLYSRLTHALAVLEACPALLLEDDLRAKTEQTLNCFRSWSPSSDAARVVESNPMMILRVPRFYAVREYFELPIDVQNTMAFGGGGGGQTWRHWNGAGADFNAAD